MLSLLIVPKHYANYKTESTKCEIDILKRIFKNNKAFLKKKF